MGVQLVPLLEPRADSGLTDQIPQHLSPALFGTSDSLDLIET